MHHTIHCVATSENPDGTVNAVAGPSGEVDVLTLYPGQTAGIVDSIAGPMGVTFSNLAVAPGDTIAVTGALGDIPDYQIGMFFTVTDGGRAFFANAGHLAAVWPD